MRNFLINWSKIKAPNARSWLLILRENPCGRGFNFFYLPFFELISDWHYLYSTVACSKRSDSGERCEVKKAMKSRGGLGREVRERSLYNSHRFHICFYVLLYAHLHELIYPLFIASISWLGNSNICWTWRAKPIATVQYLSFQVNFFLSVIHSQSAHYSPRVFFVYLSVCNLHQRSVSLYEKVQCSPPTVVSSAFPGDLSVSTGGVWKPGKTESFCSVYCLCMQHSKFYTLATT